MIDWLPRLRDTHEHDPEAVFYSAVEFVARILRDPAANDLLEKHAPAPGARERISLQRYAKAARRRAGVRGTAARRCATSGSRM